MFFFVLLSVVRDLSNLLYILFEIVWSNSCWVFFFCTSGEFKMLALSIEGTELLLLILCGLNLLMLFAF